MRPLPHGLLNRLGFSRFLPAFLFLAATIGGSGMVRSGPVLGPITFQSARVWVQLEQPAEVQLMFWPSGTESEERTTPPLPVGADRHFQAVIRAEGLQPGTRYDYAVLIDGQPALLPYRLCWETPPLFRDRKPPPDFTFVLLSGHTREDPAWDPPYRSRSGSDAIFASIQEQRPAFLLWAGHMHQLRDSDHGSPASFLRRITHSRESAPLQELLGATPSWVSWGPADWGPLAEAADTFPSFPILKSTFQTAWGEEEASSPTQSGIRSFTWADCEFFLLDPISFFRSDLPGSNTRPSRFGINQLDQLFRRLRISRASFKFICSGTPLLNTSDRQPSLQATPGEREYFQELLRRNPVPGLIFLTGGLGQAELTKRVQSSGYDLFELASGPVTAPTTDNPPENYFREPGTSVNDQNYALIRVQGAEADREIQLVVYDGENQPRWERIIRMAELGGASLRRPPRAGR